MNTEFENKKVQDHKKSFFQVKDTLNLKDNSNLEYQLKLSNEKSENLEQELITVKSDMKRILELERQERREFETKALNLVRGAKRKWEISEKDKMSQLNKRIETQTTHIAELCTNNNDLSKKLRKAESELKTSAAELKKLRIFQIQHKESLSKMKEISRQSAEGVENELKLLATRAHNQLAELKKNLELETSRCTDLENKLRSEQNINQERQSRLNASLKLAQSELANCQEQLKNLKEMISFQDVEMEELRKESMLKTKELIILNDPIVTNMRKQNEKLIAENEQFKNQLEITESNLGDTITNLEQKETIILNLEKVNQDIAILELQLQTSLKREEDHTIKIKNLEELQRKLEENITKLEAENACLEEKEKPIVDVNTSFYHENISQLEQQIQELEQELQIVNKNLVTEQRKVQLSGIFLYKKDEELSEARLDRNVATKQIETAENNIQILQEEIFKMTETLKKKEKDEEIKSAKLLKEMENANVSLEKLTKESTKNKMETDFAKTNLMQGKILIEELRNSNASLQRDLDVTYTKMRETQRCIVSFQDENENLKSQISKQNNRKHECESKLEKLQKELNSYQLNNVLLKQTCIVLEGQLSDYEKLTNEQETQKDNLLQEKIKLHKDLKTAESKLKKCKIVQNEEKIIWFAVEKEMSRLESETTDIERERNNLAAQKDDYKQLTRKLNEQVVKLSSKCENLERKISQMKRLLDLAKNETMIVKEESSQYLSKVYELKEMNKNLVSDLQANVGQCQELQKRVSELEDVLNEIKRFYEEREVKTGSTCQQLTKLIDYLQLKLEECSKKKKGVCDKIFGFKQRENLPLVGNAVPISYRDLENQLESERAKVKALTEELINTKAVKLSSPVIVTSSTSLQKKRNTSYSGDAEVATGTRGAGDVENIITRQRSIQKKIHNLPHIFTTRSTLRTGKCATCLEMINFGKKVSICSECQTMAHLECSVSVPTTCDFAKQFGKYSKKVSENLLSLSDSLGTLTIDESNIPERDTDYIQKNNGILMESWVKVPDNEKSCWEKKYLKLQGSDLCIEHQPSSGMAAISCMNLSERDSFTISETVDQVDLGIENSDLPFFIRVESNPSQKLEFTTLNQADKNRWLKALQSLSNKTTTNKYETILKLEKYQLDLNCVVEIPEDNILLLGAEEGLFSYKYSQPQMLKAIKGNEKVYQLSLHTNLGLALMISGEDGQLVSCDERQLKNNALADESYPKISTSSILSGSEACHLYQIKEKLLCAATASRIIILKWMLIEESGGFIEIREFQTKEPCSCALIVKNLLIFGCHKFFQIDTATYEINDFPKEDDNAIKAAITNVPRLKIFPICVLEISNDSQNVEILLCYNEFGVFVNEYGQKTRNIHPNWSHLPFSFAYRAPYLFVIHFSSVEIMKIDPDSFTSYSKKPERTLLELNNPRYLGLAGSKGIYVSALLELLKIEGISLTPRLSGSPTSIDSLDKNEESTSDFSFTSSLIDVLDGPRRKQF